MEDIFLNPKLKDYYMEDFNNLLMMEEGFWALDNGFLKQKLIEINSNPNIQTLYSKYGIQGPDDSESYIELAFTQNIELKIFRSILPNLIAKYSSITTNLSNCYYRYSTPRDNGNFSIRDKRGIGCLDNKDYFRINTIKIHLEAYNIKTKNEFWQDLALALSELKAE